MIDRSKTRDTPWDPAAIETAHLFGTRVAETILASGHVRPHKQAGHMSASDPIKPRINSCKTGGVHIWVPDGTKYVPLKDIVLKDAFDEYLARIVCFCFSISPQPFVAQVNRATAETAKAQATEEGLGPVLNWFKRLFDLILQRHLSYGALEFVWIDDREMDPSAADAIDVADVKGGIRTINEVRMARGLDPLPGGDKLMVATGAGYQPVDAPPPAQSKTPPAPFGRIAKFNPNHWPGGAPDSEGGEFAPKGEGGAASDDDQGMRRANGAVVEHSKPFEQYGAGEGAPDTGAYAPGNRDADIESAATFRAEDTGSDPDAAAQRIVKIALQHLDSRAYLQFVANDAFAAGRDKCNKFVADMIVNAGLPEPRVHYSGWKEFAPFTRIPDAHEWGDANVLIPGWAIIPRNEARPGDVIAEAHAQGRGHVGIVTVPGQTISASDLTNPPGIIVINNWGFRPAGPTPGGNGEDGSDQFPVVRRFVGFDQ